VALASGTTSYLTTDTSNWGVDANWNRTLPTALADAVVGLSGSNTVSVTGAGAAKSLTVSGNNTLSVGYGGALTAAGNCTRRPNRTMTRRRAVGEWQPGRQQQLRPRAAGLRRRPA